MYNSFVVRYTGKAKMVIDLSKKTKRKKNIEAEDIQV